MKNEFDRIEFLNKMHKNRKENTRLKIESALKLLENNNRPINFKSVSEVADVSKATLYNNEEYRNTIMKIRNSQAKIRKNNFSINYELKERNYIKTIESLKRTISKLKTENNELKNKLEIILGEYYKDNNF